MRTSPTQIAEVLRGVARRQHGYFTAKQALEAGYADSIHAYHVKTGDWEKVLRGIYRLADEPLPRWPDLVVFSLWSRGRDERPQGVYCLETALAIHRLGEMNLNRIDMYVPPAFRRNSEPPERLRLHKADFGPADVEFMDGLPVTTLHRTLADLKQIGSKAVPAHLLEQMLRNGGGGVAVAENGAGPGNNVVNGRFMEDEFPGVKTTHKPSEWGPGVSFEAALDEGLD